MYFDTVRCNIRPFNAEDIDVFMSYRNDMDWMKYQGFKGLSKQEAVSAVICFLTTQGIKRVQASVAIGNDASVMLLDKLKFTFLGIEDDEQIFYLNVV